MSEAQVPYHRLPRSRRIRRSMMEIPGNVPSMLEKARNLEPDILMLDFEDSVPTTDEAKRQARRLIAEFVQRGEWRAREVVVRINRPGHRWCLEDLAAVARLPIDGVLLSKVYSLAEYCFVEQQLELLGAPSSVLIHFPIETPGSLLDLPQIAQTARRLTSVIAGGFDYCLEVSQESLMPGEDCEHARKELLASMRSQVLAVARAYGLTAMDGLVVHDPRDPVLVAAAARSAKLAGFDGGAIYHPAMIAPCNAAFSPSLDDVSWAREVITRLDEARALGRAATLWDATAVLPQHYVVAQGILQRIQAIEAPRRVRSVAAEGSGR